MIADPISNLSREIIESTPRIPDDIAEEVVKDVSNYAKLTLMDSGGNILEPSPTDMLATEMHIRMSVNIIVESLSSKPSNREDFSLLIRRARQQMTDDLVIRSEEEDTSTVIPNWPLPCKKCGKKTIYYWSVQTRTSDEAATDFFKCLTCGNMTRKYG